MKEMDLEIMWIFKIVITLTLSIMSLLPVFAGSDPDCVSIDDLSSENFPKNTDRFLWPCSEDAASQIGLIIGGRNSPLAIIRAKPMFGLPSTRYFGLSRQALFDAEFSKNFRRAKIVLGMAFLELISDKNETDVLKRLIWFRFIQLFPSHSIENQTEIDVISKINFDDMLKKNGGGGLIGINIGCVVRHDIPRHEIRYIISTDAYQTCIQQGDKK